MARHPVKIVSMLLLCVTAGLATEARADGFGKLNALVHDKAAVVVGVDHAVLRKHAHHSALLDFVFSQGHLTPLATLRSSGLDLSDKIGRSVSYRISGAKGAIAVFQTQVPGDTMRTHGRNTLAKAFEEGRKHGYQWFTVAPAMVLADVGDGRWIAGPSKGVHDALEAVRKGAVMTQRGDFKRRRKSVDKKRAMVWAVSFVSQSVRKRLQKRGASDMAHVEGSTLLVTGSSELKMLMLGHTATADRAREVAKAINGKIQRKILDSRILNALVGSLVRQLKVDTMGTAVRGRLALTTEQAGTVTRYGPRVIRLLR